MPDNRFVLNSLLDLQVARDSFNTFSNRFLRFCLQIFLTVVPGHIWSMDAFWQ